MQLRLARTSSPTEMRISWTSQTAAGPPEVRWGSGPARLTQRVAATTTTYTPADMCGEPARSQGWWEPHYLHTAVLDIGPALLATAGVGTGTVWYQVRSRMNPAPTSM